MLSPPVLLASASPRRRELLAQLGIPFVQASAEIDETPRAGESPWDYVQRLSLEKARALQVHYPDHCIIGSDTSVVVEQQILGKPADRDDALRMLALLSGREHQVFTGIAVVHAQQSAVECVVSDVRFRELKPWERAAYYDSGEPMDKAGAYAIQGKGAVFITHLSGSFSAVMGLPVAQTAQLLQRFGVDIWRSA